MKTPKLRAVPDPVEKPLELAGDIYAEVRVLAHDRERWARMHVAAGRRQPLEVHQPPHRRLWTSWERR